MLEVNAATGSHLLSVSSPDERSCLAVRAVFWLLGTLLALMQAWGFRYFVTSDAVAYMDMSDGVLPGGSWQRLINGIWSPLYPFILGLARQVGKPSPIREIRFDHFVNVPIFLFAFVGFEFLLQSLYADRNLASSEVALKAIPKRAVLLLGYALFLWASLREITLQSLRPDMLMSGFLYFAVGIVVRMRGRATYWIPYAQLGVVLGLGYLAKAPMLPIGILLLGTSLFIVGSWRRALPATISAVVIFFLIGSIYYVSLSRMKGRLTLGDSSSFNYLVHVDGAGPGWYLTDMGMGLGTPRHSVHKVFDQPPTYEFAVPVPNTHPLRFDPSYWTEDVKPRVRLRTQAGALLKNFRVLNETMLTSGGLIAGFLLLCFLAGNRSELTHAVLSQWPLILIGLSGIAMYTLVHVEERYIGAFFAIFWLGLISGSSALSDHNKRRIFAVALAVALSIMVPLTIQLGYEVAYFPARNIDGEVATALQQIGVKSGEPVARISTGGDLGWARAARVHVISEVDWERGAHSFWSAGAAVQEQVLQALANTGARAVIAHNRGDLAPPGWRRLGKTPYWLYLPKR